MSNKLEQIEEDLRAAVERKKFNRRDFFQPYPKQAEFFDAGLTHRERLLMAGNQQGKTEAGAFEVTCHLTGEYPWWWVGRKFDHAVRMWVVGETSLLVRDVQQKKLCGPPGVDDEFGTGYIPRDKFHDRPTMARGVSDAYDTIQVKHKTGGVSTATFKSYEQGRAKFQGEPIDFGWCDEEPPQDIYSEILTRTNATEGSVIITFTPLNGMTDVVESFLSHPTAQRYIVRMTLKDALHISDAQRAIITASYPAHEREARINGVPMMGSGRIFPYPDEAITEPPISFLPPHWAKLWGIDFGIDHPFGAVLIAWDKDADVIHVLHALRVSNQLPLQHAAGMRPIGAAVPVAWPQDGTARESSGETLASQYRKTGLLTLATHATWPQGGVSTEAGILEMQDRFTTGRLKIASHLSEVLDEIHMYHRKDGVIVKIKDDLLSALRIAIMMKRYARLVPLGGPGMGGTRKRNDGLAEGLDFNLFG